MKPKLITIGFSHYCEKARWALDLAEVDYREEKHPPGLHYPYIWRHFAGPTVPVLVTDEGVLQESSAIVEWANRKGDLDLYPGEHAEEVRRLEAWFGTELAVPARQLVYHYGLPNPKAVMQLATAGASRLDAWLIRNTFWAARRFIPLRVGGTSTRDAIRAKARVRALFDEVGAVLGDRRYLVGERFTAADLSFAALGAATICPERYGVPLLHPRDIDPGFAEWCAECAARPAGQLITTLYEQHRGVLPRRLTTPHQTLHRDTPMI